MVAYTFYEADNRVRRYAETLVKRGDQVDAIALQREGQAAFEVIRGVRIFRIQKRVIDERGPLSYLKKLLMFFVRSLWLITGNNLKDRYDVIHVHSVPDFQVFAAILPRLTGTKVILDIHDIVPEFYANKFKVGERSLIFRSLLLMEKVSIAFSNHVIISNHLWEAKLTQRSVLPEKCTTMINYPDLSIFARRVRVPSPNGEFVLCYPGTLNHHQGVDLLVTALSRLREKAPQIKLLVIGDGPDREKLKAMVTEYHLEDRVNISGFVPAEEVAETMANSDLGVVPKRSDSFGNEAFSTKIMEFMAMGVPVLASKTRIDQYYFNDCLVHFFQSGDEEDLAAQILELANDPTKCRVIRENALEFIKQNNWDVKKSEYLDLVDLLVQQGRSAPRRERRNRALDLF
jgi:glycosyltransferase involved in cell wall biosynthesis